MALRGFVCFAVLNGTVHEEDAEAQTMAAFKHFAENITIEKFRTGIVEFPDGPGDPYMLPARVEADKPFPFPDPVRKDEPKI